MSNHHAAYGLSFEELDVVVVEDSRQMQTILRSILLSFKVERVRVFDTVDAALESMLNEPPNLIISDWRMEPATGYQMLRLIRHKNMAPLCFVPLLFVTAHGTRAFVEKAFRAGAHHLLAKPVSPSMIHGRLNWLLNDARQLIPDKNGFYSIEGVGLLLEQQADKMKTLDGARAYHQRATRRYQEVRETVDHVFNEDGSIAAAALDSQAGRMAAVARIAQRPGAKPAPEEPVPPSLGPRFAALRKALG
ncbi:response regulator [Pannonibacter phragmitetus]|uniref:response regulator n=1 Tax=Pannonibacter phragmitetus TaxID=121719 RepID=UPI003D2EC9A2